MRDDVLILELDDAREPLVIEYRFRKWVHDDLVRTLCWELTYATGENVGTANALKALKWLSDQRDAIHEHRERLYSAGKQLIDFLEDTVTDPDAPEGIDLACSSTPLAETLRDKLNALQAALDGRPAKHQLETKT